MGGGWAKCFMALISFNPPNNLQRGWLNYCNLSLKKLFLGEVKCLIPACTSTLGKVRIDPCRTDTLPWSVLLLAPELKDSHPQSHWGEWCPACSQDRVPGSPVCTPTSVPPPLYRSHLHPHILSRRPSRPPEGSPAPLSQMPHSSRMFSLFSVLPALCPLSRLPWGCWALSR